MSFSKISNTSFLKYNIGKLLNSHHITRLLRSGKDLIIRDLVMFNRFELFMHD
jgi:hypothetical protein